MQIHVRRENLGELREVPFEVTGPTGPGDVRSEPANPLFSYLAIDIGFSRPPDPTTVILGSTVIPTFQGYVPIDLTRRSDTEWVLRTFYTGLHYPPSISITIPANEAEAPSRKIVRDANGAGLARPFTFEYKPNTIGPTEDQPAPPDGGPAAHPTPPGVSLDQTRAQSVSQALNSAGAPPSGTSVVYDDVSARLAPFLAAHGLYVDMPIADPNSTNLIIPCDPTAPPGLAVEQAATTGKFPDLGPPLGDLTPTGSATTGNTNGGNTSGGNANPGG